MKIRITFFFLFVVHALSAQIYSTEAAMYSRAFVGGTARAVGSAGAFGSVGADLGSISINPAGLGLYRSTDFSATPAFFIAANNADYLGTSTKASLPQFYFAQAGFAWTHLTKKTVGEDEISFNPNKLRSFTIAFNYQRQNMFGRNVDFAAVNPTYSTISAYTDYLNSTKLPLTESNYSSELIYARLAQLIGYDDVSGNYYSNVTAPLLQMGNMKARGGKDDIDIAAGFNVNDKFYFGFGVGIPIIKYNISSWYGESNLSDTASLFNSYSLLSELKVSGVGVNAKFGVIYRPAAWVRMGLSYQIPTYYKFNETYAVNIEADYDTALLVSDDPPLPYKYQLRTPMKGVASASFYFKQHGFISVDYEFLNYGASRVNLGSGYPALNKAENDFIKANYTFGHNVKVGLEGAVKSLRLRAGYSFSSTPYKKSYYTQGGYNETRNYVTAGIGYRGKMFYTDLAYVYGFTKDLASTLATDYVKNKLTAHQVLVTFGFRFGRKEN